MLPNCGSSVVDCLSFTLKYVPFSLWLCLKRFFIFLLDVSYSKDFERSTGIFVKLVNRLFWISWYSPFLGICLRWKIRFIIVVVCITFANLLLCSKVTEERSKTFYFCKGTHNQNYFQGDKKEKSCFHDAQNVARAPTAGSNRWLTTGVFASFRTRLSLIYGTVPEKT